MRTLVGYASAAGSTQGIAERIAKRLQADGHTYIVELAQQLSSAAATTLSFSAARFTTDSGSPTPRQPSHGSRLYCRARRYGRSRCRPSVPPAVRFALAGAVSAQQNTPAPGRPASGSCGRSARSSLLRWGHRAGRLARARQSRFSAHGRSIRRCSRLARHRRVGTRHRA